MSKKDKFSCKCNCSKTEEEKIYCFRDMVVISTFAIISLIAIVYAYTC